MSEPIKELFARRDATKPGSPVEEQVIEAIIAGMFPLEALYDRLVTPNAVPKGPIASREKSSTLSGRCRGHRPYD
jgi:hypothetical protein